MLDIKYIEDIKQSGLEVIEMRHGYRINGCVDIYKGGKTLYNKHLNKYEKFTDQQQLIHTALELANTYGPQDPFKKAGSGRMTYQEFKHKHSPEGGALYHIKNNNQYSKDYLYFIKAGHSVKIGRSINPEKRLLSIKTGAAYKCRLLLKVSNKGHLENKMHKCLSHLRMNGEWFMYGKEIKHLIRQIKNLPIPE